MHKCHNYHAIIHKLYVWFGKKRTLAILKQCKNFFDWGVAGAATPPLNTPMIVTVIG